MQQISRREEKVEPLMSRRRRQVRRNERSSGSLCSAAARDPESVCGATGPAEGGEQDPRR